eukprot:1151448-Prorocentrum_lima.AAC.1
MPCSFKLRHGTVICKEGDCLASAQIASKRATDVQCSVFNAQLRARTQLDRNKRAADSIATCS